ncbi:MAG: M48 family metallopeptidase, partial [Pseudomonadales bacterium]|nr:M48 family metallopeptidase [Pseudomonadales bacterium]
LFALGARGADNSNLPKLGDRTSGIISLEQEHELGQELLRELRAQAPLTVDPVLQDYLEHLIYKLALNSELQDRRLSVVLIDARELNAFAAPGGVVGVHDGLFLYAENQNEIAAILAHELAHLSQRHFARGAESNKNASIPSLAGLLAGVIIMAAGGGDAGLAAITAGQALSQSQMLGYSRGREAEADRVGIRTLARADMDPRAMATMFERLERASRFSGNHIPEFLLTHPVTKDRIADSYNQVQQYPKKDYPLDIDYQMMRARVIVHKSDTIDNAILKMRDGLKETDPVRKAAYRYGLALALTESAQYDEAEKQLDIVRQQYPNKIALTVAEADIYTRSEQYDKANDLLASALAISPGNYPLTMAYATSLTRSGDPHHAEVLLKALTKDRPDDVNLWYQLAETYGLANNILGVHEARAEYFVLVGNLDQAITQLGYAIPLVRDNYQQTARIQARIEEIHHMREERRASG